MASDPNPVRPIAASEDPNIGSLESLREALCRSGDPLFAILDAARDPRILPLLRLSREEHACLYDGQSAEDLQRVAPYLVRLPGDCRLLKHILLHGWGNGWGVFLTARRPFAEVRSRLRHFLMVEREGKPFYFRFYDPLVLKTYLPTCDAAETREFFKDLTGYLMEDENPKDENPETLLCFTPQFSGVKTQRVNWMPAVGVGR